MKSSKILSKSEIKSQRVKKIFIDTTKEMIIKNGVDSVSIRKIADSAGYTFATMYNHFKDLDELLMLTRDEIINDIASYLLDSASNLSGKEMIRHTFKSYINYCIKYPNAFRFFFLYTQKEEKKDFDNISSFIKLGEIFSDAFTVLGSEYKIEQELLAKLNNTIFFSVHGMLIVYLSNNYGLSEKDIYDGLDNGMDILLSNYNTDKEV